MECEPCIKWFLIEYWMIIYSVSFACLFDWFCLWLRVCLIDFIWIKLFDWFTDLFSNTCLIALCTLTMHSLVQLLPQDLTYGIGGAVLSFLGSPIEIKHNTARVIAQSILNFCFNTVSVYFVYDCVCGCCCCCDGLCLCLCILSVPAPVLYLSMHFFMFVSVSVHFFCVCNVSVHFVCICVCVRAFCPCL